MKCLPRRLLTTNIDRFSKFVHWHYGNFICNDVIVADAIALRVATLPRKMEKAPVKEFWKVDQIFYEVGRKKVGSDFLTQDVLLIDWVVLLLKLTLEVNRFRSDVKDKPLRDLSVVVGPYTECNGTKQSMCMSTVRMAFHIAYQLSSRDYHYMVSMRQYRGWLQLEQQSLR